MKRVISTQLKEYFDGLELGDPFPENPVKLFLDAAKALIGVHEEGRDNAGPIVTLMQQTVGVAFNEPWCVSMVMSLIAYVEATMGIESPIPATEHVLNLWNSSQKACRTESPVAGDVILWKLVGTTSGHCGIVMEVTPDHYLTIEGNTSPAHHLDRNGDGVYLKQRPKTGMGRFEILGFLRPFTHTSQT